MGEQQPWVSDRARAEQERHRRVELFDAIIDKALDGEVELNAAILDFETEIAYDEQRQAN